MQNQKFEILAVTHFDVRGGENGLLLEVLWLANREAKQPPKP